MLDISETRENKMYKKPAKAKMFIGTIYHRIVRNSIKLITLLLSSGVGHASQRAAPLIGRLQALVAGSEQQAADGIHTIKLREEGEAIYIRQVMVI